ncbi:MAG: 2-phosphosulfolactate phosphatase [Steroidobacteraceae bacterium]
MKVVVTDFVVGARAARGIAVVINVFRAFSLAAYALDGGATAVLPMDDLERARQLKRDDPRRLLFGERHAQPPPDFDGGNSPAHVTQRDVRGRELIHTTHAGTQGLVNAMGADEVLTGALVNAKAIVRYIRRRAPEQVTLVRMGYEAETRCTEDDLCAELLLARLCGEDYPTADIRTRLRAAPAADKFFDPACQHYAPQADFELCTEVDRFDFVLKLDTTQSPLRLMRIDV